jgi:saccharopepsin
VDEDTLRLGELEVPNQQFVELKYYESVYPDEDVLQFDSVLGLGYDGFMFEYPYVPNVLPSPFNTMVQQGILDENKFALQVPRDQNTVGDLTFGGYNEDFVDGELVSHSLFPENTTYWHIQATSLSMTSKECGNDVVLFNETLTNHTAALWTTYPGILLPSLLAQKALWKINSKRSACTYRPIVDCDAISSLPHITLGFPGQEIVLKGEDYTMRYEDENPRFCQHPVRECWLMVEEAPNQPGWPQDLVILGTSLLKGVYAVFDWDRRSVSCEFPIDLHNAS